MHYLSYDNLRTFLNVLKVISRHAFKSVSELRIRVGDGIWDWLIEIHDDMHFDLEVTLEESTLNENNLHNTEYQDI